MMKLREIRQMLFDSKQLLQEELVLSRHGHSFVLRSNNASLLAELTSRLRNYIVDPDNKVDPVASIVVFEGEDVEMPFKWRQWPLVDGEGTGIRDLKKARAVRQSSLGLTFLQSRKHRIARGACAQNLDRIEEFIHQQFANELLSEGGVLCYATCIRMGERAIAIAGPDRERAEALANAVLVDPRAHLVTQGEVIVSGKPGFRPLAYVLAPKAGSAMEGATAEVSSPKKGQAKGKKKSAVIPSTKALALSTLVLTNRLDAEDKEIDVRRINPLSRPGLITGVMVGATPFSAKPEGGYFAPGEAPSVRAYVQQLKNLDCYEARIDLGAGNMGHAAPALLETAA